MAAPLARLTAAALKGDRRFHFLTLFCFLVASFKVQGSQMWWFQLFHFYKKTFPKEEQEDSWRSCVCFFPTVDGCRWCPGYQRHLPPSPTCCPFQPITEDKRHGREELVVYDNIVKRLPWHTHNQENELNYNTIFGKITRCWHLSLFIFGGLSVP